MPTPKLTEKAMAFCREKLAQGWSFARIQAGLRTALDVQVTRQAIHLALKEERETGHEATKCAATKELRSNVVKRMASLDKRFGSALDLVRVAQGRVKAAESGPVDDFGEEALACVRLAEVAAKLGGLHFKAAGIDTGHAVERAPSLAEALRSVLSEEAQASLAGAVATARDEDAEDGQGDSALAPGPLAN